MSTTLSHFGKYNQLQMSRYQPKLSKVATIVKKKMTNKSQAPESYRGLTLKQYFELEHPNQELHEIEQESQSELQNQPQILHETIQKSTLKKTGRLPKESIYLKNKTQGQNSHRIQLKKFTMNEAMTQRQETSKKTELKLPSIITTSISPSFHTKHNSQKQEKQSFHTHKRIRTEITSEKTSLSFILPEVKPYQSFKVVQKLVMGSSKSNESLKLPLKSTIQSQLNSDFFLTFSKLKADTSSNTTDSNSNLKFRNL